MLLIFVMFNLFVETEEIDGGGGGPRRSGDNKGQTGPMGWAEGWVGLKVWGGVERRARLPSVLAAAASGTHFECWMSKRETPSLSEDGPEHQRGTRRRRTFCDLPPECTRLCCAEVQLLLSHLFCPLQCPDAAPLTHTFSLFLSEGGRMMVMMMMMDR